MHRVTKIPIRYNIVQCLRCRKNTGFNLTQNFHKLLIQEYFTNRLKDRASLTSNVNDEGSCTLVTSQCMSSLAKGFINDNTSTFNNSKYKFGLSSKIDKTHFIK